MGQRPRGMTYRRYLEQLAEANVVDPNPQSYYPERVEEVFRFALTKTTSIFAVCNINANSEAPHQAIALYKQIPPQKYKSAEELIEWAKQNSIPAPPIELLRQCLEAKDDFQLPKYDEMEKCRPFLIRYMREMGEICTLKFPQHKWESMYAIDYLVEDHNTTQSGASAARHCPSSTTEPSSTTVTTSTSEHDIVVTLTDKLKTTGQSTSHSASDASDSLNSSPDNSFDSDSAL